MTQATGNATKHTTRMLYTPLANLAQEFTSRGLVVLSPQQLAAPLELHQRIFQEELAAYANNTPINPQSIPGITELLSAPGLIAAVDLLIGEDWAIVPFTHNAPFCSGAFDQQWHKDDNGPYNSRKMRHHHSVQLEMLYYPQAVSPEMGPTATIPYSHYWTFNHEENNDNFAGADHLDFDYLLNGMEHVPVSGADSKYTLDEIQSRTTTHDIRMRDKVKATGWPLVTDYEAAPLEAGSVVLYSHNTFHRGNHRRDDYRTWKTNPRFMWRFYMYRTHDPVTRVVVPEINWRADKTDALTQVDVSAVSEDVSSVWRYQYHWLQSGMAAPARNAYVHASHEIREQEAQRLYAQLQEKHDAAEPRRIGAAYQLASLGDVNLSIYYLEKALYIDRENVRRAVTYGLIAVGDAATPVFMRATSSYMKWIRKVGVFGLGEVAPLNAQVLECLSSVLINDESVYVRSVAAGSLGCLARRAIAQKQQLELIPQIMFALISSLDKEVNRLAMSAAQYRSIKMVRPTDDCDVCEGDGVDFGINRFSRLRSAVRENVLWSMVMLCSHGSEILGHSLETCIQTLFSLVKQEKNVIVYGYALDALHRLAYLRNDEKNKEQIKQLRENLENVHGQLPLLCMESMIRSQPLEQATDVVTSKAPC